MKEPNSQHIIHIFQEYQARLRSFISKRIPSQEDTEDILQNIFYQLSRNDTAENPILQVSAWLYTVAQQQIIDWYKRKKESPLPAYTDQEGEDSWIDDLTSWFADEDSSPEIDFLKTMIWEELELSL